MYKVRIIHGPNLNLLGIRQPQIYGKATIGEVNAKLMEAANNKDIEVSIFQSNSEGLIINDIHQCLGKYDGIVINPGALSHYSYAIRDAIEAVAIPAIEVHLSNIYARDEFRRSSVIAPICIGQICGFGPNSYALALEAMFSILSTQNTEGNEEL